MWRESQGAEGREFVLLGNTFLRLSTAAGCRQVWSETCYRAEQRRAESPPGPAHPPLPAKPRVTARIKGGIKPSKQQRVRTAPPSDRKAVPSGLGPVQARRFRGTLQNAAPSSPAAQGAHPLPSALLREEQVREIGLGLATG